MDMNRVSVLAGAGVGAFTANRLSVDQTGNPATSKTLLVYGGLGAGVALAGNALFGPKTTMAILFTYLVLPSLRAPGGILSEVAPIQPGDVDVVDVAEEIPLVSDTGETPEAPSGGQTVGLPAPQWGTPEVAEAQTDVPYAIIVWLRPGSEMGETIWALQNATRLPLYVARQITEGVFVLGGFPGNEAQAVEFVKNLRGLPDVADADVMVSSGPNDPQAPLYALDPLAEFPSGEPWVAGQVVVRFNSSYPVEPEFSKIRAASRQPLRIEGWVDEHTILIGGFLGPAGNVPTYVEDLRSWPTVEIAEPNYLAHA